MKLGIIGTGAIACNAIEKIEKIESAEVTAIWFHTFVNGERVANTYHIKSIYGDIDEFLSDTTFSIVYIALPNPLHYEFIKKSLSMGKHVICEKPFTANAKQAAELIELAKQKQLFLFDGTANHFYENYWELKKRILEIGTVKMMHINLSQISSKYEAYQKGEVYPVFDPSNLGGALYDLNSINLLFVVGLFGEPLSQSYFPNLGNNGIDTSGIVILTYPGFQVDCIAAKDSACPNYLIIQGDKGYFKMFGNPGVVQGIEFVSNRGESECIDVETVVDQRENIFRKAMMVIKKCDYKRCYDELNNTLIVMKLLEQLSEEHHLFVGKEG